MAIRHLWVLNKSKGAYLKEEFLEAYLIQAVLIEAVAKDLVRFKLPIHCRQYKKLIERFSRLTFNEAIDYLAVFNVVKPEMHKKLKDYNHLRNQVFHEILNAPDEVSLKNRLKIAYEDGRQLHDMLLKKILKILNKRPKANIKSPTNSEAE